ncbi:MAG: histidine phosphatase family protein [Clostridia bacterium]|nr:histidine phosphatase family protein [Clostridia bacterium]
MFIYIIRHGETYGNLNGDGFAETDLTPRGRQQIAFLGKRFLNTPIDKIYVSPLIRALKTANAIRSFHPGTPMEIDSALLEKGTAPDYCGLSDEEILALCPFATLPPRKPLGVEDDTIALNRAKAFIEKIKAENSFDDTILVVAHGTFNSYLVLAALDFPFKENFNFSHLNTGVTLVQYLEEDGVTKMKLKYLNDTSHLV